MFENAVPHSTAKGKVVVSEWVVRSYRDFFSTAVMMIHNVAKPQAATPLDVTTAAEAAQSMAKTAKVQAEAAQAEALVVQAQAEAAQALVEAARAQAESAQARAEVAQTLADWSRVQAETAQALADKLSG